jgi:hypothetical protein
MKNITTLVLNLVISESKLHRIRIADTITDLLETYVADFGGIEKQIRIQFLAHISHCVDCPNAKTKDLLFEAANFYKEYYLQEVAELLAAA